MKFSKKLTVIFGVLFLIFGGLIAAVLYFSNVRTLEVKEKEHLSEHALHVMDKIDRMLFERYADIQVLATDPVISSRGSTPAQITQRLQAFQAAYKAYASLSFFDMNRVRIADTSGEKIGEQRKFVEYWIDLAEGKEFVVNLHKSITLNKIVIHFVQVVKDKKGIPFGVVVSRTPVDELNEIVEKAEATHKPGEFKIELLDRNGLILYSNKNKDAILKEVSKDWEIIKKSVASGIKNGAVKYTNPKEDIGEEVLSFEHESGYREYKGNDWTLVLETPTSIAFASAIELRNRAIIVMLIFCLLALIFIYLFSSKISLSIEKMTDAADEISKGNLDVRIEITSKDETGRLAETFNRMATDLTAKENKLIEYGRELEAKVLEQTSDLRKTNELLKKRDAGLATAQQIARLGNWESDMKSGNIFWSDEMYRIYGFADERFTPSFEIFLDRVHPEDRAFVIGAVEAAIRDNKPHGGDFRIVLPDGTVRYIHAEEELILDDAGRPTGLRGTAQDITERKGMEKALKDYSETLEEKVKERTAELREAKVLAEAANIAKSEFLANMSHELRTPLNAVIGFSQVILDGMAGPVTGEQRDFVKDIHESGQNLLSLINDILELSRIEIGETEPVLKEFDIRPLLEESLALFKEKASRHNISATIDMRENLENVTADKRFIKQIVVNLLSNAFKFTPDGGSVRVSARRIEDEKKIEAVKVGSYEVAKNDITSQPLNFSTTDGNFLEISIADSGIGIAKEDMERLFVPFKQLEPHLTKKYGGAGVGLYLAKRLVELLNGRIWAESEKGKGSKFSFVIPMRQRQNSESRIQKSE